MQKIQKTYNTDWVRIVGTGLLLAGGTLFLEVQFKTGWLFYIPFVLVAGLALRSGFRNKKEELVLLGLIILLVSIVVFVSTGIKGITVLQVLGISFLSASIVWTLYFVIQYLRVRESKHWIMLPAGLFLGLGIAFLTQKARFIDFLLWISIGISLPMLIWGYARHVFGLLIAGCIIFSSGVGVAVAWGNSDVEVTSLARTGIMLVTFALGWGGISVFSKRFFEKVAWWPLIPAGILSMSGWGLFIGGTPGSSKEFLGNTLSLSLIILGLYVLLLRSGFNKKE